MKKNTHLKIAFIAGSLGLGGAEKQLMYILESLKGYDNVDITLYTLQHSEYYEKRVIDLGIKPVYIGKYRSPIIRLILLFFLLVKNRPHILQAVHSFSNVYAGIAGRLLNIMSIGAMRSSIYLSKNDHKKYFKLILKLPHALVFNARSAVEEIKKNNEANIPLEKIFVLENVIKADHIPLTNYNNQDTLTKIIYLGKLNKGKGVADFIDALHLLPKEFLDKTETIIIGDGPEKSSLEKKAQNINCKFVGNQTNPYALMATGNIFVFPSISEGFPNVVIEAMMAGLPVITTPAGDIPYIVENGKTGFVVPFKSPKKIADKILLLMEQPELQKKMGEDGHKKVNSDFNYNQLNSKLIALYEKIATYTHFKKTGSILANLITESSK